MTCRLAGGKPLSEPVMEYYQLDPWELTPGGGGGGGGGHSFIEGGR